MPASNFTIDSYLVWLQTSDFTVDSVLKDTQSSSIDIDATIFARHFMANAWILGERWRHHRIRDHFGIESDLYVALSADVGPYVAFTPIHYVLEDMVARIESLENSDKVRGEFTFDAWLALSGTYGRGIVHADAIVFKTGLSGSFDIDARIIHGGSFTMDCWIRSIFTIDAFII